MGGSPFVGRNSVVTQIVHVGDSTDYERSFHLLRTDMGAFTIVLWYRPPEYNEVASIESLFLECEHYNKESIGH